MEKKPLQYPGQDPASRTADSDAILEKRLLHVIRSMSPEGGGPMEGLRKLASGYRGEPMMEVACLDDPAEPYLKDYPFAVHALGPGRGHYGHTPRLKPWLDANVHRFDGVVINGLWQFHSYGTYQAIRRKKPYVIFPHGMLDPYFKKAYPLKHLKKQTYWLARESRILRDAKYVCFTTDIERDDAAGTFWPSKWNPAVVSFGTTAPEGDPGQQREAFLKLFPHLRNRRFLLFLSRIHPKKGCDLLIEAFARFAPQEPDLDLVMAGPDQESWRHLLEKQAARLGIRDRVHWTGMLTGDPKWGAFYAADAFILPSHQENFGIAVAEALACGLPVLISNKVNIWPDVEEDQAGFVGDDTAEGAYQLLLKFHQSSPEALQQMRAKARRCFDKRYVMERTTKLLNDLFR